MRIKANLLVPMAYTAIWVIVAPSEDTEGWKDASVRRQPGVKGDLKTDTVLLLSHFYPGPGQCCSLCNLWPTSSTSHQQTFVWI